MGIHISQFTIRIIDNKLQENINTFGRLPTRFVLLLFSSSQENAIKTRTLCVHFLSVKLIICNLFNQY